MKKSTRPFCVAGNWKLYKTPLESKKFAVELANAGGANGAQLIVFPQIISLPLVSQSLAGSPIQYGAQNCAAELEGAFTGESSIAAIAELKAQYVLLGHSERRHVFFESDDSVARKIKVTVQAGLVPVLCVGETLSERDSGVTETVIQRQVESALKGFPEANDLIIAYEPVWAIGTGRVATPDQAEKAHKFIRYLLVKLMSAEFAERTKIWYGGSVKPENARELYAEPNIDGFLVGGASLKIESFLGIVKSALG